MWVEALREAGNAPYAALMVQLASLSTHAGGGGDGGGGASGGDGGATQNPHVCGQRSAINSKNCARGSHWPAAGKRQGVITHTNAQCPNGA